MLFEEKIVSAFGHTFGGKKGEQFLSIFVLWSSYEQSDVEAHWSCKKRQNADVLVFFRMANFIDSCSKLL